MAFPSPQELLSRVQGGSSSSLYDAPTTPANPTPDSLLNTARAETGNTKSFGQNLFDKAASFVKTAASKVGSFLGDSAESVKQVATGQLKLTPQDYLDGTIKTFTGLGKGVESLAIGFNEGVARIGKSASTAVLGPEITKKISDSPIGGFAKVATGRENFTGGPGPEAGRPLPTYQEIYDKAHSFAIDNNASMDQAKIFSGLTVIGALFADSPIFGGEGAGAKSLFKLSEEGVQKLATETTEEAIKATLKAENPGLTDVELDAITPVFREAKTPDEVRATLDQIQKIQQVPLKGNELPTPEEVFGRSQENLKLPNQTADITKAAESAPSYFRSLDSEQGVRFIPVEGQPVKIMEGIDTFIHRPEDGAYEVLEASTGRKIGKAAETPEAAIQSAKQAIEGKSLQEVQARIAEFTKLTPREARISSPSVAPGVRAAEGAPTPLGAPKPFSQDLIRSISQEDIPGPILDMIRKEFPTISDQALAPIAKRLAGLKRTGDIEGIMQVVRNISEDIGRARSAAGTKPGPVRISKEALDQSIAKVNDRKAVGDLPPSIGELMTSEERGKYLDLIQRAVKDPEQAVLAQQEYEALFEHADQRILDRYEELKIHRDLIRDALDTHPGKELNDLYKGSFLSPTDNSLEELMRKRKGKDIDGKIADATGTDAKGAQKVLDDWLSMREQLKGIEADLREIRPKARAARILQTMVEDVPVIARKQAGEIESLANPEDIRTIYRDISGFSGQARDVYRNFEHVFGDKYDDVKRIILDPFDKSKGDLVDTLKQLGDDLEENIIKKYGFQRGSKESAAIQRYGDTGLMGGERRTIGELEQEFGKEKARQIVEADAYFRKKYDELISKVNQVRAEIYPNDPSKLVPRRKDYYRHFQELGDGFRQIVDLFETPSGIDPQLAGLSEWTKPKSKFLSFAQTRLGKSSDVDAIGGFLNYAPSYAYAIHMDPHIGNFRYLRRRLAENAPTPEVRELVPAKNPEAAAMGAQDLVKQKGINNFLTFLDDFANDLAGKTNPMDRYLQKVIPGGRKTFRVIDWINSRVKANAILGNLSSAIAQFFNVPNGIASAKFYTIPGIKRTLAGIVTPNDAMAASSFIKERYQEDLTKRFKLDWVEHPVQGSVDRGREMAAWITGALDELGTKLIWNSHYAKGIAEGVADPVKYADDITRQMVAGRGIGEVPLVQKSKIFQLVAPFQLEVGNAWYVLSKFIKRKDFGAVATLILANYLFNRAAEEVRGSPVVFDPIQSLIDGATDASDEMQDNGNAGRAALKFTGRQVGEILSNVPFGQTVAAALPDDFVKNTLGFQGGKKELFGSADPGRFGSGLLAVNGIMDPLYKLIPPFGGAQVKRTIDGVSSMLQGQVKDSKNNLSFKTDATPLNVAQAVLFGKNSTQQAQEFYDTRDDLFKRIYRQDAARSEKSIEAEKVWADVKKLSKDQALAKLQELDKSDPDLADAVAQVAQDESLGLTGTERLIKMLGVENGERAKYISDTVEKLPTREEQVKYLQTLDDKKLISDDVFKQLQVLLPGKIKDK